MVENGQIAAVLVEGGNTEATLKRFYFSSNTVMLNAENPAYAPLVYVGEEIENVHVIGLAVAFTKMWRKAPAFRHGDISRPCSPTFYCIRCLLVV